MQFVVPLIEVKSNQNIASNIIVVNLLSGPANHFLHFTLCIGIIKKAHSWLFMLDNQKRGVESEILMMWFRHADLDVDCNSLLYMA